MGERDVDTYSVIDASGAVIGEIVHVTHTAVKGFRVSQHLTQRDLGGRVIVDARW